MIKLSDYLVKFLKDKGVKHIFMVTGGGSMHINDSVGQEKSIKFVCNHHEQASAIAAESYARISNNVGVCQVTTGPGGTNTITGVIGAWLDSIPMLIISGQVKTNTSLYKYSKVRQIGIQEINIIDIAKPITKYAQPILDPNAIKYHLEKAWYLAKSGRPGPVWLDIPLDIQSSMIDETKLNSFEIPKINLKSNSNNLDNQVNKLLNLIAKAKRPVIVAGFGIRLGNAVDKFFSLVDILKIPVVTSISAHDLMWEHHPLYAGRFGLYGNRAGNFAVQNSDLLIVLGCRMNLWEIGYQYETFAREAVKVMVDIDKFEMNKPTFVPDLKINCNINVFFTLMLNFVNINRLLSFRKWIKQCKIWQNIYPVVLPEYKNQVKLVNYYYFVGELSKLLSNNSIIVTGNGTAFTATCQSINLKKGQRLCLNVGCASMGYDLPAAIGAYFADKTKNLILITGDGSIQMNLQELQTIVHNNIPVKIFVINNNGYMAIRITQNNFFKRFYGTDSTNGISFPNILNIAKAYGIDTVQISNHINIKSKLKKVINNKGPIICEIIMNHNQELIPKITTRIDKNGVLYSPPLEDMYPFLSKEELLKNLYIKPI
jgi:acetolactate synthase-1/2/3 large subunit